MGLYRPCEFGKPFESPPAKPEPPLGPLLMRDGGAGDSWGWLAVLIGLFALHAIVRGW